MISGGSHPLDEREIEQLKLQLTEAEATTLNLEWRLGEAEAALADAKGVVTAAEAWRDWFPHVDSMFAPENTLIAAVDAFKGKARVGASGAQLRQELPSFGSPCICGTTGHAYGSQVVYELNADADCPVHGEHRLAADLADINARVAADERVLDAAEAWRRMVSDTQQFGDPGLWPGYVRELFAAAVSRALGDTTADPGFCTQCGAHLAGEHFDSCPVVDPAIVRPRTRPVSDGKRIEVETELWRAGVLSQVEPCGACEGTRWEDDQNWQPEQWELAQGRKPGAGRIPCGLCNLGGWSVPDGLDGKCRRMNNFGRTCVLSKHDVEQDCRFPGRPGAA